MQKLLVREVPFYLKFWVKMTAFEISVFARSVSAVTPSEKSSIYIPIIPILCVDSRNVERPERRPTVLTTMSHCQAIVSRIVRVGIAATYCHFRWPAFRSVGIKAVTGYTRECNVDIVHVLFHWPDGHSADRPGLAKLACVLSNRPERSNRSGHRPTVEPGRFATPTSRTFLICIGLNGVRRRCAR